MALILVSFLVAVPTHGQAPSAHRNDGLTADESNLAQWLPAFYRDWLTRDVAYIITKPERIDFLKLTNDDDRDSFMGRFWERRNPDPDSTENLYKAEIYRRIAYANEHFSEPDVLGQLTDRGRIYITWGPPDEIVSRPSGESYFRSATDGGGIISTYPYDDWIYRYLEGIGDDVNVEFIDPSMAGKYQLAGSPAEREGLFGPQETGITAMTDYWQGSSATQKVQGVPVGYRELETTIASHLYAKDFSVQYRAEESTATSGMSLVTIQVAVPLSEFQGQSSDSRTVTRLNLFCRITNRDGHIVETLQGTIYRGGKESANPDFAKGFMVRKNVPLKLGSHEVAIAVGNPESQRIATIYTELVVSGMQSK